MEPDTLKPVTLASTPESLAGVCAVEVFASEPASSDAPPELLIEVPHGATRRRHFAATRRRLRGEFPADLEQFFFVNTDVGSIECARWVARMVTSPARFSELDERPADGAGTSPRALAKVLVVRGLVARTFIDFNRVVAGIPSGGSSRALTPGLPEYVREPGDVRTLMKMHAEYQAAAASAYETVCGAGGGALILHTYAPRSILIDGVDEGIVAALRRAYDPANYESWARRPAVDLITETEDGERLAPEQLAQAVRRRYAAVGVEVAENATYRLHATTMGHVHSARYPGRVLCLELNRELLADPFTPFAEMRIGERQARRMAAPIAAALLSTAVGVASE